MGYELIILEMQKRILVLEEQVKNLTEIIEGLPETHEIRIIYKNRIEKKDHEKRIGTKDIVNYIEELKKNAYEKGETNLILTANNIHKNLKLINRMPLVCNAMRRTMSSEDEVVHETPSGYSSTLQIKYYLDGRDFNK